MAQNNHLARLLISPRVSRAVVGSPCALRFLEKARKKFFLKKCFLEKARKKFFLKKCFFLKSAQKVLFKKVLFSKKRAKNKEVFIKIYTKTFLTKH
jgi:hypothetical protein